jgi:hypothetical protein
MSGCNNKSGYQLRADLLGMAIGILESRNDRQEANEHFLAENGGGYERKPIAPFATEDVLEVAEKLYQFVQTKS